MFNDDIEETVDKAFENKRYRAVEKQHHEFQMRIKSWIVENSVYIFPLFVFPMLWFMWGMMQEASLPYGESFDFLGFGFFMVVLSSISASFFSYFFLRPIVRSKLDKEEKELSEDVYQKGANFTNTQQFNISINRYIDNQFNILKSLRAKETFVIKTDRLSNDDKRYESEPQDIIIPRDALSTGLCIMGSPGRGKSVLMNQIIEQIPKNNHTKEITFDVKGEFVEKYYDPSRDIILCPSDIRSIRFDLYKLVNTRIAAGAIAEILVSEDKNSQDPHWVNSARAVMEGILLYAAKRNLSNKKIFEIISKPSNLKKLLDDEEVSLIVSNYLRFNSNDQPEKETSSIVSTLARKAKTLQYLSYLDDLNTPKIDFNKWLLDNNGGTCYMLATENLSKVYSPLYGVVASYLISTILSDDDSRERDIYFILDELPRLGKALGENLEKGLAVGRSKGLKFLMAMQSYSQIKKEFGEKEAEAILDTTNSYVVFQNNYGAQFLEKYFGKTTVLRNNESYSFGMDSMADRVQLQRQTVKEALIDESEIMMLDNFEFYAKIEGCKQILKTKLSPYFIPSQGIKKYIENPKMNIEKLKDEIEVIVKKIKNRFVDLEGAKRKTGSIHVEY